MIDYNQNILCLRNIATGKEFNLLPAPELITDCFWSPDSRLIAYYAGTGNIRLVSADGGQPKTIIEIDPEMAKAGKYAWPMGWASDSKKLIFQVSTRHTEKGLYAVPVSGGKWEEIYKFPDPEKAKERDESLTLSPDGKWIAYQSKQNGNQDIYVMPARGGEPVQIPDDPANDSGPLWSYDGQWLAFRSSRAGENGIWVIRITPDGKPGNQPVLAARGADNPVWTQDGRIAYTTETSSTYIFVANMDGTQESKMTRVNNLNFAPRWSPDGKRIAYIWMNLEGTNETGNLAEASRICTIDVNGGEPKLVTNETPRYWFCWSRDSRYIIFSKESEDKNLCRVSADGGKPEKLTIQGKAPDVSPDGKKIAYYRTAESRTEFWLAEHFLPVDKKEK